MILSIQTYKAQARTQTSTSQRLKDTPLRFLSDGENMFFFSMYQDSRKSLKYTFLGLCPMPEDSQPNNSVGPKPMLPTDKQDEM